jgi:hypothetical protein
MSFLGLWNKKQVNPYGSLNPEQVALNKKLGSYFSSVVDTPSETYPGQLTENISPEEQKIVDSSNRLAAMAETSLGYDSKTFNQQFQSEVADPTYANFSRNAQPILEEALPTFSIARGKIVSDALSGISENLLTQRNATRESALNRQMQLPDVMASYAKNAAIPRVLKQAGLDKSYLEWVRGNDSKASSINQMLNFLGISTGTYIPEGLTGAGMFALESMKSASAAA